MKTAGRGRLAETDFRRDVESSMAALTTRIGGENMAQGSTPQNAKQRFWDGVLPWAMEMKRSVRASLPDDLPGGSSASRLCRLTVAHGHPVVARKPAKAGGAKGVMG